MTFKNVNDAAKSMVNVANTAGLTVSGLRSQILRVGSDVSWEVNQNSHFTHAHFNRF